MHFIQHLSWRPRTKENTICITGWIERKENVWHISCAVVFCFFFFFSFFIIQIVNAVCIVCVHRKMKCDRYKGGAYKLNALNLVLLVQTPITPEHFVYLSPYMGRTFNYSGPTRICNFHTVVYAIYAASPCLNVNKCASSSRISYVRVAAFLFFFCENSVVL